MYFLHRESNMPVQAGKQLVEGLFSYKKKPFSCIKGLSLGPCSLRCEHDYLTKCFTLIQLLLQIFLSAELVDHQLVNK